MDKATERQKAVDARFDAIDAKLDMLIGMVKANTLIRSVPPEEDTPEEKSRKEKQAEWKRQQRARQKSNEAD